MKIYIEQFLSRFLKSAPQPKEEANVKVVSQHESSIVTLRKEAGFDPNEKQQINSIVKQHTDLEFYQGHVEHGYSLAFVATQEKCPRCHAATKLYYANFVYATQIAPRVMLAPAGYFCTKCPTVIIDENMVEKIVSENFHFNGILAIDYDNEKEPDFFRTWNGKDAIYILEEDGTPMGLGYPESTQIADQVNKIKKNKHRNKIAKQSRKQNRHKR